MECAIIGKDPRTGVEVDVSVTSFADDVREFNMIRDAAEALQVIEDSNAQFDAAMQGTLLKQNVSKAEHVPSFVGAERDMYTNCFAATVHREQMGSVKRVARYLGGYCAFDGSPARAVQVRVDAAKTAFYTMAGLWKSGVGRKNRSVFWKGIVWSTLLSGLECDCLLYTSPSPRDVEESRMPSSA